MPLKQTSHFKIFLFQIFHEKSVTWSAVLMKFLVYFVHFEVHATQVLSDGFLCAFVGTLAQQTIKTCQFDHK